MKEIDLPRNPDAMQHHQPISKQWLVDKFAEDFYMKPGEELRF
tara:strand:- start:709 stop:837 length:129 start_codon:yes stop_codon:yes gene_type:complete